MMNPVFSAPATIMQQYAPIYHKYFVQISLSKKQPTDDTSNESGTQLHNGNHAGCKQRIVFRGTVNSRTRYTIQPCVERVFTNPEVNSENNNFVMSFYHYSVDK
jgi:hypothetical protein